MFHLYIEYLYVIHVESSSILTTIHFYVLCARLCRFNPPGSSPPATFAAHHPRFLEADQVNGGGVQWEGFGGDTLSNAFGGDFRHAVDFLFGVTEGRIDEVVRLFETLTT